MNQSHSPILLLLLVKTATKLFRRLLPLPIATNSRVRGVCETPLLSKTVGQCLEETAHKFPEREALVFFKDGVRKTFSQFKQDVDLAAAGLLALGLKKGDRLGMWGPNKYEWVLMQFATAQAGIILVSVNPAYQAQELEFVIRKVGCKALVFPTQFKTQKYYEILKQACPELETASPGAIKSKRGRKWNDSVQGDSSRHRGQPGQRALTTLSLSFQGTTGSPKGATLSHHNIVNNAYLIGKRLDFNVRVAYGTTENSPVTFMGFPQDDITQKTETVGCVFPHTEAKIENPETGEIVPLNSPGELQVRGYCVMIGYWADPNKTSEVITDEKWYKTGDIAILDKYGYCKIIGRCKDMIIRGGENIYPAEIEQFLHTHPKLQEVQVVGVNDPKMGEEICACITVKAGQECTAEEIKAFCKGKVGSPRQSGLSRGRRGPQTRLQSLVLACPLAVGFSIADLSFQDPTVHSVCQQLPAHCLWQGE
uniref:Medium-chain acyl-CoA ligase ACSF2, mitochondrial n=1 Tax=Sphenodon punctatus TaxID=8508 RepID=A0A8D0H2Y6_SPHPU